MTENIPNRSGDPFMTDDESQILNTIDRWLEKDVKTRFWRSIMQMSTPLKW